MKRILVAALLLISATLASAQEGKNLYNKYSSEKGVSAVYISPAMLKLIGQLPDLKIQTQGDKSLDIGSLISSFHGFYMLEITEPSAMATLKKDVSISKKADKKVLHEVLLSYDYLAHSGLQIGYKSALAFYFLIQFTNVNCCTHNYIFDFTFIFYKTTAFEYASVLIYLKEV